MQENEDRVKRQPRFVAPQSFYDSMGWLGLGIRLDFFFGLACAPNHLLCVRWWNQHFEATAAKRAVEATTHDERIRNTFFKIVRMME